MLNNVKEPDMQIQRVDPNSTMAKAPTKTPTILALKCFFLAILFSEHSLHEKEKAKITLQLCSECQEWLTL